MSSVLNDCWPTHEQKLLLQAALLKVQDAINAWEQWNETVDYNDIDYGSQRLLPLLYRNLLDHNIQSPLLKRYKGVYRRYWLSNQLLFNRTEPLLAALHRAGIEILLLKGAGLVLGYNLECALRPMADIDFRVSFENAQTAIEIVKDMGWSPKLDVHADFDPIIHAATYHNHKGQFVDIHWYSIAHDKTGNHDQGYWERSFGACFGKVPVRVMGATDLLIQTCVHGIRWNSVPPIRWIADALILFETHEKYISWEHLLEHSDRLRITLPMFDGLDYLKKEFGAPVPEYILHYLGSAKVKPLEKLAYQLWTKKPLPVIGDHTQTLFDYWTYHRKQYLFPSYLRFLQYKWHIKHLWQVPFVGAMRIWRKIRVEFFNKEA